jgi:hypothetical protein
MTEPTCGQGLAEHAAMPARLGELMAAMAQTLRVHRTALDPADEDTRAEDAAYASLAEEQAALAGRLNATAEEMNGYRDLPMGRHDVSVLTAPEAVAAFERFVAAEEDLLALLERTVEGHRAMLGAMRSA